MVVGGRGVERMWPLVDLWPGPSQLEAPLPSPILGMYIIPTVPTVEAVSKDTALREQGGVETIWIAYVPEPSKGLYTDF